MGGKANKPSMGKYGYPLGQHSTDFKIFYCLQGWNRRYICCNAWRNHEVAKSKVCSWIRIWLVWNCKITELMQLILLNVSQSEFCPPLVVSTHGQKQKTNRTGDYTETRRLHKRIPLCTAHQDTTSRHHRIR